MARILVALGFLCALLGTPKPAAADDAPGLDAETLSRARVVSGLDELSPEEKNVVVSLGVMAKRLTGDQTKDCAAVGLDGKPLDPAAERHGCALDALLPDWRKTLQSVTKRLGTQGGWKAGILADLLPRGLLDDARARDVASKLATQMPKPQEQAVKPPKGKAQPCASVREGEVSFSSVDRECHKLIGLDAALSNTHELLQVKTTDARRIDLITVGAETRIQTFDGDGPIGRLEDHKVASDRYFFLVPLRSAVTLRVFGPGKRVPIVRTFGGNELFVTVRARGPLCLLFDMRPVADPKRVVLVNGQDLGDTSSIEVSDEHLDHGEPPAVMILAPSPKANGQYRRLESRSIPWANLTAGKCYTIPLDLTHPGGVAVIGADAHSGCAAQGVTNTKLRADAEAILEQLGEKPRKMADWRNAVKNFGDSISPLRSDRRLGGPVGRLDSSESLLTNAEEFARQGFSALFSLELSCRGASSSTAEFTLHATRLDVVSLAEPADAVSGRDVDQDLRPVSESVSGEGELEGLMIRVLSRLQGKPYVWTQPDARLRRLQGSASERVSLYVPADRVSQAKVTVSLDAHKLLPQEEYVCRSSDGSARLSTQEVALMFWKGRGRTRAHHQEALTVSPGTESTSTVYWNPYGSGLYLLRLEAATGDKIRPTTFRCVEVKNQNTYIWVDLSYQRGLGPTPARAARNDTLGYGRLLGGMALATDYDGNFNFGFAAGYGNAVHSRNTPSAWEVEPASGVMPAVPHTPLRLPLNWTRQSLLFGPSISVRWSSPICAVFWGWSCTRAMRSFDLVARALPLVDVGVVDASGIDPQLRRFLDGREGLDLDLSASLEAGVMIHFGGVMSISIQGTLGVLGWDDFALGGREQSEAQSSITYDAHWVAGGSMGVTWGY